MLKPILKSYRALLQLYTLSSVFLPHSYDEKIPFILIQNSIVIYFFFFILEFYVSPPDPYPVLRL